MHLTPLYTICSVWAWKTTHELLMNLETDFPLRKPVFLIWRNLNGLKALRAQNAIAWNIVKPNETCTNVASVGNKRRQPPARFFMPPESH